ncbi:UDP-N-acetylmuramate dehydrogenase, partial [Desulfosarcina cetonica]|uniref:UDP-N-acetylmuramate dehydrogenase n=1 Tax=Desulfosarcina cetonica TaxID=90730 RepID=UPI0006D1F089
MQTYSNYPLTALNTFGVPAVAARYVRFDSDGDVLAFLHQRPLGNTPRLILGGGSNLLFVDDYDGLLLHPVFKGVTVLDDHGGQVRVRAMAGETWDDLVALAVARGWGGIENLSLIPGMVGAAAVQNIGAYGVEIQERIEWVEAIALGNGQRVRFSAAECGFGYRRSRFKEDGDGRFMVTAVALRLNRRPRWVLDYPGVRDAVAALGAPTLDTVRQTIITIRRGKLPDPAECGNAGSFFKNPMVDPATLAALRARHPDLPHYPQADGRFKLAAGWLIERCGWKGRQLGR